MKPEAKIFWKRVARETFGIDAWKKTEGNKGKKALNSLWQFSSPSSKKGAELKYPWWGEIVAAAVDVSVPQAFFIDALMNHSNLLVPAIIYLVTKVACNAAENAMFDVEQESQKEERKKLGQNATDLIANFANQKFNKA